MTTYYKARLVQDEDGSNNVWFDEYEVIHETKYFVYCITSPYHTHAGNSFSRLKWLEGENEPNLQLAKKFNIPVKRVHKQGSRFAFATKEEAFKRLKFMKSYHVRYLRHELRCVEDFLQQSQGKTYEEYEQARVNELLPLLPIPLPWENETHTESLPTVPLPGSKDDRS